MSLSVESIVKIMEGKNAVPPLVVWSTGFMDILDDIPQGGIPEGQHGRNHESFVDAAAEYLQINSFNTGTDVFVTKPSRIMDSVGKQVYP